MRSVAYYRCHSCGSTKEIIHETERSGGKAPNFPLAVHCGWRGCTDVARRKVDVIGSIVIYREPSVPLNEAVIIPPIEPPLQMATRPRDWAEKARKIIWGG